MRLKRTIAAVIIAAERVGHHPEIIQALNIPALTTMLRVVPGARPASKATIDAW